MEAAGNGGVGGSGSAPPPPWDLGMHWAPAPSPYAPHPHQPLVLRPAAAGGCVPGQLHLHRQQQELTCLKLGKRPWCWAGAGQVVAAPAVGGTGLPQVHAGGGGGGGSGAAAAAEGKRKAEKPGAGAAAAAVARCQVEGCHVALAGAKEYHRRHKVCEAHSKAPRVVVLGAEQRFCQQCSRFHAISEFDDAKRSCRRRLAGHNERRRKSNASEAMARGAAHPHAFGGHGFLPPCGVPAGALSLLSSARPGGASWLIPAPDISTRSSAALDELIAENRAALLAWQFSSSSDGRSSAAARVGVALPPAAGGSWHAHHHDGSRYHHHREAPDVASNGHTTTLDLMQTGRAASAAPAASSAAGAPLRPVPERGGARPAPGMKDGGDAGGCGPDAWAAADAARVL